MTGSAQLLCPVRQGLRRGLVALFVDGAVVAVSTGVPRGPKDAVAAAL